MILKEVGQIYLEGFEGECIGDLIVYEELQIIHTFIQYYWYCKVGDSDELTNVCRLFVGSDKTTDTYKKRSIAIQNFLLWGIDMGYIEGDYEGLL